MITTSDITYEIFLANFHVHRKFNNIEDVCYALAYTVIFQAPLPNNTFYRWSLQNTIKLSPPNADSFVLIDDITPEIVEQWIISEIGQNNFDEMIILGKEILLDIVNNNQVYNHQITKGVSYQEHGTGKTAGFGFG